LQPFCGAVPWPGLGVAQPGRNSDRKKGQVERV